ncbi:MAG: 4Fe-4S dicluster domain-containing protein [Candidatus Omnitrophica bacterium]|nr:4Fe-4S dicluster domain-containing protein [Candidatus Omnitrophota bacterium]MDD5670563.1 4Fe-4S dicluster domain-containing protein [Candidatus Omnitrophota bacterium]
MMNPQAVIKKSDIDAWITKLAGSRTVVAPVRKGAKNFAFAEVKNGKRICLKYIPTILPPKKYFMPQREMIQMFDRVKHQWQPAMETDGETVLLGVHTCDLSGIGFLNTVMDAEPRDVYYAKRRAKIVLIGIECNDYCDEFASCKVMNNHMPNGNYDLFFTELSDSYWVHIASPAGEKIVSETGFFAAAGKDHQKELDQVRAKKQQIFKDEVKVKHEALKGVFANSFESPVWDDLDKRCVACGNCTNVCPTCYCFDIRDELNLDLATGCRVRVWDGCQNEDFAKVAGGENFRKKRGQRQRHRYMRKFNYPVDKFKRYSCTGCGRCTRTCMAKISLKETINALAGETV